MSVKSTLQERLREMRRSEAEVTRRLLRNLGLVANQSLREVAAGCHTSDTTVMRACRAAGYDGFQDLKYHVLRELTGEGWKEVPARQDSYQDDLRASLSAVEGALGKAANLIEAAHQVVLAGVGASLGVALIATDILFTLGKPALPVQSEQMASFAFATTTRDLLVLAISHSGETQFPLQMVKLARECQVKSIGITNEPGSSLARAVDVLLPTQAVESPRGSYAIAPRLCQLAVLDALFNRVNAA